MEILLSIVLGLLSLVWLADGFRLRKRAKAMTLLQADPKLPLLDSYRVIKKSGARVSDAMIRSAMHHAQREGLQVLLVSAEGMPTSEAMLSLQTVDTTTFRKERMGSARMLGEFFLAHTDTLDRMDKDIIGPNSAIDFAKLASEFKKYAFVTMDFVLMGGLQSSGPRTLALKPELLKFYFGPIGAPWLLMQLVLLILGFFYTPVVAVLSLLAYLAQPLIVLHETPCAGSDLFFYSWLRPFLDAKTMTRAFLLGKEDGLKRELMLVEKREHYKELLAEGTDRFFEARREDCPICASKNLHRFISTRDRFQFKPGRFDVDRCQECSHIFQNPRLSIEGLEFYYKDFYDGLGEEKLEGIFSHGNGPYLARAKMVEGHSQPTRWLDVGGGHGHFCLLARDVFPEAAFDGLDLSSSVMEAEKKGWTNKSYRGLFPELAEQISAEANYDVISMSHYLEHTRDPASEIEAAAKLLPEGGHLLIELPDPESRFGRIFKSFWLPWFQPQHQHFLSATNLERLLKTNRFEPVRWHRGEAHHPIDIMFSFGLLVTQIAKPLDLPWLPARNTWLRRTANQIVYVVSIPFLVISRVLDLALAPFLRRPGWSNAYRVLAKRIA